MDGRIILSLELFEGGPKTIDIVLFERLQAMAELRQMQSECHWLLARAQRD